MNILTMRDNRMKNLMTQAMNYMTVVSAKEVKSAGGKDKLESAMTFVCQKEMKRKDVRVLITEVVVEGKSKKKGYNARLVFLDEIN